MSEQTDTTQMIEMLEVFLQNFNNYAAHIFETPGATRRERFEDVQSKLRRTEPTITDIILKVLGNKRHSFAKPFSRGLVLSTRNLIGDALIGGNNAMPHNFRDFYSSVTSTLEQAIGTLEAGLWPPKTPTPVLVIHDDELRQRCADLLARPGNYDTVIREATTVLEDRIRHRPPFEVLAKVIPNSADQTGDNLVNRLLSPDKPVLSVSSDRTRRIALHRMLLAVVSYLRNPYHHQLDDQTHQSWAWSAVGLIDRLLADIDSCTVEKT